MAFIEKDNTATGSQPKYPRIPAWRKWLLAGMGLLAALALVLAIVVQTSFFRQRVLNRLVAALEQATGGQVELKTFSLHPMQLAVALEDLVIHGREGQQEQPLFAARRVELQWNLITFWRLEANLHRVRLWEPRIYIAMDREQGSNLPISPVQAPGKVAPDSRSFVIRLLALQILHLEVLRGQFRWNDQSIPLDFRADKFRFALDYEVAQGRYAGALDLQNVSLIARNVSPLSSQGRLRFYLDRDGAEVETLEWRSPQSRVSAQAKLRDFLSPKVELQYEVLLDWKEAADLLGARGWEGKLTWAGRGVYGPEGWNLEGEMDVRPVKTGVAALRDVRWSARALLRLLRPASASAQNEADRWSAELEQLEVPTLGGRFTGTATVAMAPATPLTRLHLQAHRISLPAMTKAVPSPPVPLDQLSWAGAITGPLEVSFSGMGKDFAVSADWKVEAPLAVPPGFTPVSGVLRGSYNAVGRFDVQDSYLDLPQTRLAADGWFSRQDSRMKLSVDTSAFDEVRPLMQWVWEKSDEIPFKLHGRAGAEMLWSGGSRQAILDGSFNLADFSYQDTRWEQLSGSLRYEPQTGPESDWQAVGPAATGLSNSVRQAILQIRSGKLAQGPALVQFDLTMGLENGSFTSHTPFSAHASLSSINIQELQNLFGLRYPVQGLLQASLQASGTREKPIGQGTVTVTQGTIYQEPFDRLTVQGAMEPGNNLSLQAIRLQRGTGLLEGSAAVQLDTKQYRFALQAAGFPLQSLQVLGTSRVGLAGELRGQLSGEGSFDRPQFSGQIELADLRLREQDKDAVSESHAPNPEFRIPNGNLTIHVASQDRRAQLQWTGRLWQADLRGSGELLLREPFEFSAALHFGNLDVPVALAVLGRPWQAVQGKSSGSLALEGDFRNIRAVQVVGQLSALEAMVGPLSFRNLEPLQFRYQNRLLEFEQVHVAGPDMDLVASGSLRVSEDPTLDITTQGEMNLEALSRLDAKLSSAGRLRVEARFSGTLERPFWRGQLQFSNADFRYGDFPNGLSNLRGAVVFEGNRGILDGLSAESGGGEVLLGGFVSYARPTGWQWQISADAAAVRLRYPTGISTVLGGRVSWTGTTRSSLLAGRMVIDRQRVSPQMDLAAVLSRRGEEPASRSMPELLRNLRLDVEIFSAPDIRLETVTARNLGGDVDLNIRGTAEHPSWLGRIGNLQGELFIAGRRYSVNRGEITFLNPFRVEPFLNLSLQARVQQYDISLEFTGPPDRLSVTYRSDPPLPVSDILALLVAGSSRETTLGTSAGRAVPEVGANALLSQALTTQIGSRLDRIFGAGRIRIDPQLAGFGRPANASVAFEQQIGDNFTVLYITNVTSVQQQTVRAEWAVSPRFSVVGIRDQNGLLGVNLQLTLRFR
ncbi:MAG: translocation/assembly module TamB domain-containing protein [Acidobacteria bacterium]|nr:translocation/assembly module TamB domain-containing protein [Acidobacteriota bacterium]